MIKDIETQPPEIVSTPAPRQEESREPEVSLFHDQDLLSTPGIYKFWRGRVALYGILKSLGVGPGDIVLVPGFTCFAVPAAVLFTGARPFYVDIDPDTFNISLESVQSAWNGYPTARIKAVIIQHTFGLPANLNPILRWARTHRVAIIEDCAHAWGSRYQDESGTYTEVGTSADAAFFSSQWTKPVSTGLGGWAKINKPELDARMCQFYQTRCVTPSVLEAGTLAIQVCIGTLISSSRAHWTARSIYQALYSRGITTGTSTPDELLGKMPPGYAKRMSKYQCRLLDKQLRKTSVQDHRRKLRIIYEAQLESVGLPVFQIPKYADPVLLRYPVRVRDKKAILKEAERRRIELGDWYTHPIDQPQGLDAEAFAYRSGTCPVGERAAQQVVNLPMHSRVTEETVDTVVKFLKEVA